MISAFFNSIEDYPNIDTFSYDELINHFGKPEDIFCTYIKDSDESVLIKKHKSLKQKKLKLLILIVLLSLIFISAIFLSYSQSKNSYINREKIEITQDE